MKTFLKPWWGKLIAVVVLLLLVGIVSASYIFWQLREAFPRAIAFDAAVWQAANTDERDNPRCLMRYNLEQNYLKLGMTRAELTTIFGEVGTSEKTLSYYLGFCNPFGVDGESLALEFDSNDKLIEVRTIQH